MKSTRFLMLATVMAIAVGAFAMDAGAAFHGMSTVMASSPDSLSLLSAASVAGLGITVPKAWYTNDTQNTKHIGSVTIPPGETREVDASLVPGEKPAEKAQESTPPDPVAELLKKKVSEVTAELPNLSDDDLAKAAALEQDGQARKSLLEAMVAENLRRAQQSAGGNGGAQ